ncbi:MAG: GFA family protein [Proteobacteria bacterium]|nr:GFA family protein [Pseudomonadota bacterium]
MKKYEGGCHCGKVRFRVRTDFSRVSQCNCSICVRKGALHQRVAPDDFELLAGKEALSLYQFGTRTAKHYFCSTCGIYPFAHPRTAPELVVVNIRCLDDFAELIGGITVVSFDGRNWDEAARALRKS